MARSIIERLTRIRNDLARLDSLIEVFESRENNPNPGIARMLDSIAENAVNLRADLEHGRGTPRAARLVKRVRKALGYTYP